MMKAKTKTPRWLLSLLSAFILFAGLTASCSKSDDTPEPDLKPGDEATTFQKAIRYEQTNQFQSDLDAFCTYALNLQALRYAYWNMVSFDFKDPSKAFTATPEQMMENTKQVDLFYDIVNHLVENEDVYSEAMENLDAAGIIPLQQGTVTRGFPLADAWAFKKACQNTMFLGRKSIMIAMEKGGIINDAKKLDELFKSIPEGNRRGYSNAQTFWSDFSQGKLDSRSNVIFNYLYKQQYDKFGYICDDIGVTPQTNMAIAAERLIETGSSLVLDALPMANAINKGKDLFNTVDATLNVQYNLVKWSKENGFEGLNTEAIKTFMQVWANNALNYGRDLKKLTDQLNGKDINYSALYDGLYDVGKEIAVYNTNEYLFGNTLTDYLNTLDASQLEAKEKVIYDKNGNPLSMVVMVDTKTGETKLSFYVDENGNLLIRPNDPGEKVITVVDKNSGKRTTKKIIITEDDTEPIEVEFDEILLDENPKDGYIEIKPQIMGVISNGSRYKAMIVTNYLYYTCTTKDDWLSCSIAKDANLLYFSTSTNDTGKERKGHITVSATDSKGKVLKSTVFTVEQQIPEKTEEWVTASPSTLQFDAEGGKKESVIDHSYGFNHLDIDWSDELSGWATVDWKETATGWNIVVDASANNTGEERSGTITVYAGASNEAIQEAKNGKFDPDVVAKTTILVKQNAEAPFDARADVKSCSFKIDKFRGMNAEGKEVNVLNWNGYNVLNFGSFESSSFSSELGNFTCTANGNRGAFTVTGERESSNNGVKKETFKFTVEPQENGSYGKISDLVYTIYHTFSNGDGNTSLANTTHTWNYKIHLANIPIGYVSKDNTYCCWSGGYGDGVQCLEFETTYSLYNDKEQKMEVEYSCNNYSDYDLTNFYIYVFFPEK